MMRRVLLALILCSCVPVHGAPPFVCDHDLSPVPELVAVGATLVDPPGEWDAEIDEAISWSVQMTDQELDLK